LTNKEGDDWMESLFLAEEANKILHESLKKDWELFPVDTPVENVDFNSILDNIHKGINKSDTLKEEKPLQKIRHIYYKIAAILFLPILITGVLALYQVRKNVNRQATSVHGSRAVDARCGRGGNSGRGGSPTCQAQQGGIEMSMSVITELWRMSATELAEAIRSHHVSSREVLDAHLRRIEEVNPSVNAVTVVLAEQAIDAAGAADRITAQGGELPRLLDVPVTIKENIDLVGTPTTQGTKSLAQAYPSADAPDVERLRAAGAIPIGRTNLPTLGMRLHTDSELRGATVNPWDRARTPGGR
jgi:hypothetical protein